MKGHFTMSGDNVDDRLSQIEKSLSRIADALEEQVRQQSLVDALPPSAEHDAFVWHANSLRFQAVPQVNHIPLDLLQGIDLQQDQLMANTTRFAEGLANNALLWGARGTGKSSLVKAIHAAVGKAAPLVLVEIHREDLNTLPQLLHAVAQDKRRFIIFCDDLAFESGESSYKSLKLSLKAGLKVVLIM